MDFENSDYFAYKKNKMQSEIKKTTKGKSFVRFNFLLQLFIATFIIMFIIIVIAIMKYSSRMDIEYSKGDLSYNNVDSSSSLSGYKIADYDEEQRKIDKRLKLIQQEENAPSEAKILQPDKQKNDIVIAQEHLENSQKIDKIEKFKEKNAQSEANGAKAPNEEEAKNISIKLPFAKKEVPQEDMTITSKVLVGRFSSFEEAAKKQAEIKAEHSDLAPFVRKIGDVYSVQMGSFQDFHTAKQQALHLKSAGLEVWIYQQ